MPSLFLKVLSKNDRSRIKFISKIIYWGKKKREKRKKN